MAILFTPASDDLAIGDAASDLENIFDGGNATLSAWIFFTSFGGGGFGRMVGTEQWRFFCYGTGDRLGFSHSFSGSTGIWTTPTGGSLVINTKYHVTLRYNSSSSANDPVFTINGVVQATTQVTGPSGSRNSDVGDRLIIGNNLAYDRGYDGIISDLRLIGRSLSDEECAELFVNAGQNPNPDSEIRRFRMLARPELGLNTPYVSSLQNTNNDTTTLVLTVPSHNDGDSLVMVVAAGGESGSGIPVINTPSGWTLVIQEEAGGTPPTHPVVAVYTRTASSEPATYSITNDQGTNPWGGAIINYKDINLTPAQTPAFNTGTDDSPISPSGTASENVMVLWVGMIDSNTQEPTIRSDFAPPGIRCRHVMVANGGGSNGFTLGIGEEMYDGTATGTRTWNPNGADEWVALHVLFPSGDGIEGLPVKDESNAQAHAESFFAVIGAEDELDG